MHSSVIIVGFNLRVNRKRVIHHPRVLDKKLPKQTAPPRAGFVVQPPMVWVYIY